MKAEFVNVVAERERPLPRKRWTPTNFEVFFITRTLQGSPGWRRYYSPMTSEYFNEYGRLLRAALPVRPPVHFLFAHGSWDMEHIFKGPHEL